MKKILNIYNNYKELFNYLFFGVLTMIISLLVYYLLVYSFLDPKNGIMLQIANILSWIAGVTFAYITNRKYVFKSTNKNIYVELGSFVGSRVATLIIDMLIMFVGVTWLGKNDSVVKIISQFVVVVSNYLLSKIFVFRKGSGIK